VRRSNCRIFSWQDLRVDRSIVKEIFQQRCFDEQKILYICNRCSGDIRNVGKRTVHDEQLKTFVCTCCHQYSEVRRDFVIFSKESYDFKHPIVLEALCTEVRKRNQRKEFICKSCHKCLKKSRENVEPQMPANAKCLNISLKVQKGRKCYTRNNWHAILENFQRSSSYTELEEKVKNIDADDHVTVESNKVLSSDRMDSVAQTLIPKDCVWNDSIAVHATPDGSCFFNSLSRVCFGNEEHANELRARIVIEAVKNKRLYLDHSYLCRGHQFQYNGDVHQGDIYMALGNDSLQGLKREQFYEGEIMELCKFASYAGVWQFHQAANVINIPIQGIYPEKCNPAIRKELNRKFFPKVMKEHHHLVCLMWTRWGSDGGLPNHFVPVFR